MAAAAALAEQEAERQAWEAIDAQNAAQVRAMPSGSQRPRVGNIANGETHGTSSPTPLARRQGVGKDVGTGATAHLTRAERRQLRHERRERCEGAWAE